MALPYHHSYTGTQLHRVARNFDDAADLAAFVPVAADVGKLYKQVDTGVVYELTNHVGPVYEVFNAAGIAATAFTTGTKSDVLQAAEFAADAGANDTYAITLVPAITAYVTGAKYRFKANTANTGAATLNINALGAKTIKKVAGGITTDLDTNDIRAGQWVEVTYDGTNMQMLSESGNAPFTALTRADILQAALFGTDSGAADAYVLTLAPAIAGYVTGVKYSFKATNANTGASTINVNGAGAKSIKKMVSGTATALAANDIRANQWCDLIYDGTDMLIISPLGNAAAGGGSGSKTLFVWEPFAFTLPATSPAYFSYRNSRPLLIFINTSNTQARVQGVMPEGVDLSSGVKFRIKWIGNDTSGNVGWQTSVERGTTDIDTDSFDSAQSDTDATNGTNGIETTTEISHTSGQIDSVAAGESFTVNLLRDVSVGSNMAAYAGLRSLELQLP